MDLNDGEYTFSGLASYQSLYTNYRFKGKSKATLEITNNGSSELRVCLDTSGNLFGDDDILSIYVPADGKKHTYIYTLDKNVKYYFRFQAPCNFEGKIYKFMSQRALKRIALITMIIDHIGCYIPGMPIWLRYIGRISAPLFLFCCAWGFEHTSDKKKYLLRLYLFNLVMAAGNVALYVIQGCKDPDIFPSNQIFGTIFLGALICYFWEKKKFILLGLFAIYQIVMVFAIGYIDLTIYYFYRPIERCLFASITGFSFFDEGGLIFIGLFCLIYFVKNNKILLSLGYLFFCLVVYKGTNRVWSISLLRFIFMDLWELQYLMIYALPIMLLYNGKKGKGSKIFYYWFYPTHVWILYIIGHFILKG